MYPSAVGESPGTPRRLHVALAAIGALVGAAVLVAPSVAATSPASKVCPSAAVVDAALGQKDLRAPVSKLLPYNRICTYRGYSDGAAPNGSMTITFETANSATFATGEKSAGMFGAKIAKLRGLGQGAWTTNAGSLYVFDAKEQIQIEILALLAPTSKLKVLARELL